MSRSDVVVIGNGVAGLMSALVSAKAGKKVTVLAFGTGTYPLNSGIIDLLGYVDFHKAVSDPLAAISQLPAEHPYKKIGTANIEKAVELFQEAMAEEGLDYVGSVHQQQWLITGVGTLKPTCLVPISMQADKCFNAKEIVMVGIKDLKDYYVDMVAENLPRELGTDKKYTTVSFDTGLEGGRDLTTRDVANWINRDEGYQQLLGYLKSFAGADRVMVMPQILGTTDSSIYKRLVADLGCEVVETTGMPTSVNGFRLRDALLSAVKKLGVRVVEKARAEEGIFAGDRLEAIKAGGEVRLQTYYADKFILATGGFYNFGITMRYMRQAKEPILDLDLDVKCEEKTWTNKQLFSDKKQGFAMAGLKTDDKLHAIKNGKPLPNVYIVGRNLSGYDFCFEHSGNGVAIGSAYMAAKA